MEPKYSNMSLDYAPALAELNYEARASEGTSNDELNSWQVSFLIALPFFGIPSNLLRLNLLDATTLFVPAESGR